MEILNIGPLELIIILVLMFIILGPKDMVKTAQRIGKWVRSVTHSQMWREVWGISQDIRELPKKLMEETGLDEALTDVRQTTQGVANELNAQINEVKEAARVPEVEHLRIETNPLIAPSADSVPAVLPSSLETPEEQAAETVEAGAPAAVPANLPVAEQAAPAEGEQPAVLQVAESVTVPGTSPLAAPVEPALKKTRRKKQPASEPGAEIVGSETLLSGPVKPKNTRRKKLADTSAVAPESVTDMEAAAQDLPAETAAPNMEAEKPLKKTRRKKLSAEETAQSAAVSPDPSPAPAVLLAVEENLAPTNGKAGNHDSEASVTAKPAPRKRRTEASQSAGEPKSEPTVSLSDLPVEPGNGVKPARARKPRKVQTADLPETQPAQPVDQDSQIDRDAA